MMQAGGPPGSHQPGYPAPPQPPAAMVAQPIPANDPSLFQAQKPLLPFALYDAVLDIPFPGASSSSAAPVEVIYPPATASEGGGIVDTLLAEVLNAEFGEDGRKQGVAKIARFAFPEYEDGANAKEVAQRQQLLAQSLKTPDGKFSGAGLNRHDAYLEEVFAPTASTNNQTSASLSANVVPTMFVGGNNNNNNSAPDKPSNSLPSYHVFCYKLDNGTVVHGHVRRYLPFHANAVGRRDVGRRGVRALVILTRNAGGGNRLYSGLLKTLDILTLKDEAAESGQGKSEATTAFMHSVFREHVNVCRTVAAAKAASTDGSSNKQVLAKPRFITVPLVELGRGHGLFGSVDTVKFAIPPSFLNCRESTSLVAGLSRNDMMPMLRCLGVVKTMRLLSALMSERRVIFTSNNVSKLSAVSYGAVAMMGQGLLSQPPLFIPALAPGLVSVLGSNESYLIGVLSGPTSNFINPRNLPNIGPVVIFDLDNSDETEPHYHNISDPHQFVPDLTRRNVEDMDTGGNRSLPDCLYQDLTKVLATDKKVFWQGAVQERLGAVATKGKTAAKAAMKKGLKYLKNKSGKDSMDSKVESSAGDDTEEEAIQPNESSKSRSVGKGNYFYEQGFNNEAAEVEARIAFSTFFVSLLGDLRSYLTQNAPGTPPVVDKMKFMKGRAQSGDRPGTAMFLLLGHFMRSKVFDEFVAARLRELQTRQAVAEDAPLFALVTNHHRSKKIAFYVDNVRNSVKELASSLPGRYLISWNESVRSRTSALTSMQAYNGDARKALTQLTADYNETSTILVDTMMVLWTRMQEGKGLQWKKTHLALQIIRDLLLNGPINAIAEAIDGFASIRILKEYREAIRAQNSALIRVAAKEIYSLLVDLPVLFARRRECVNKRWLLANPKPSPLRKETRMIKGISKFAQMHNLLRPDGARVAPAPQPTADLLQYPTAGEVPNNAQNDLLSMNVAAPQPPSQTNVDVFNMTAIGDAVSDSGTSYQVPPTADAQQQLSQPVRNLPPQHKQQVVQQHHNFATPTPQQGQQQSAHQHPNPKVASDSASAQMQQAQPRTSLAPQNQPQYPNGPVFASPPAKMGQQAYQPQAQPRPSVVSQNQPQYPNGAVFASPPAQMGQQAPQQPRQHQYPQQFQHSLSSLSNNGYQQNQQLFQAAHPTLPQQQAYPHFGPGPNQPMHAQAPSHLSQATPPTLIPGQGQQQQPPVNPPKKAMNFDPFA
eukprot:scaffold5232_cov113-Skeletonema_dohrnii-CCMP3373.AAC.9